MELQAKIYAFNDKLDLTKIEKAQCYLENRKEILGEALP
jgi:hypothetical protein